MKTIEKPKISWWKKHKKEVSDLYERAETVDTSSYRSVFVYSWIEWVVDQMTPAFLEWCYQSKDPILATFMKYSVTRTQYHRLLVGGNKRLYMEAYLDQMSVCYTDSYGNQLSYCPTLRVLSLKGSDLDPNAAYERLTKGNLDFRK